MIFFLKVCIWSFLFYLAHVLLKKERKLPAIRKEIVLGVLVVIYTFVYFYWNLSRHASFNTFAVDISVYLQALSNWNLYTPIMEKSLFTEHFSPLLFLFVPIIKFNNIPNALFLIQALVIAAAAIPLYFLSRRLGASAWPAILISFLYLNFIYTRQMAFSDFHIENLIPLAIFSLFYLFLAKRDWKFWLMLVVCLLIKEDMGFYLFPWALIIAVFKPTERTPALIAAAIAFFGGILSLLFLLPLNKGVYPYFAYWSHFGQGIFGIAGGAVSQPFKALGVLLKPEMVKMILATAALPFFTSWGITLIVPAWIQLASNHAPQAGLKMYYAAPILPFLFTALAAGWVKMERRFVLPGTQRPLVLCGVALFLLIFNFAWISPYAVTPEHRNVKKLVNKLPDQGRVLAQANVAPHISEQNRVSVLGVNSFKTLPHFVVFHVKGNMWPFSRGNYLRTLDQMRLDTRYKIWKEDAGIIIFLRNPGVKAPPIPATND
ncbi:DUF2079 domain-containing protein [bacterium]|nr:DUF2079 domain-containing protein [bacterium]